jgi:hypothetical protein
MEKGKRKRIVHNEIFSTPSSCAGNREGLEKPWGATGVAERRGGPSSTGVAEDHGGPQGTVKGLGRDLGSRGEPQETLVVAGDCGGP